MPLYPNPMMRGELEAKVAEFVQVMDTAALVAIVQGQVNILDIARAELASRGLNTAGKWIGFRAAAQAAAEDATTLTLPDAIAERLVTGLGFQRLAPTNSGADFRELAVWRVQQALEEAYQAGANRARVKP